MKIIFDWCASCEEEKTAWRGDAQLISLEITQRECGFASAKAIITARNSTEALLTRKYAKIGAQLDEGKMETIFSGRLVSFPIGIGNSCLKLEFISEPDDYQEQLNDFLRKNQALHRDVDRHTLVDKGVEFDDLFFSARDMTNPTIFLEGNNNVFHWDMKTGKLSLSHINSGLKNFEISGKDIIQNSLRVRLSREPYKSVNLHISANWIQHIYGCVNLYPLIASNFKNEVVSSLTNIKSGIENICKFSPGGGYRLVNCRIKEIFPAQRCEFFRDFSATSREFIAGKSSIKFKKFYFDGRMLVNWHYRQKIVENVAIKIIKSRHGREKDIHLKLGALQLPKAVPDWEYFCSYDCKQKVAHQGQLFECLEPHVSGDKFDDGKWKFLSKIPDALADETAGSFFCTNRGKNAIRYAMQKAMALINYSQRFIEIGFSVYARDFMRATLEDQVTIVDQRFPSGRIVGKITKITFFADANHRIMRLVIACNASSGFTEIPLEKLNTYLKNLSITAGENRVGLEHIVTKVLVENLPEEQEDILGRSDAKTTAELRSILKKHPTKIKVFLHPLNTARVVSKDVNLPDFVM
ncbi:MAG: hypothetical protein LBT67_00030 [Holosporaceae bacterium]|jgi:hypothetical protein|nr:hypothetical protein [Holosporaceae bacterium]